MRKSSRKNEKRSKNIRHNPTRKNSTENGRGSRTVTSDQMRDTHRFIAHQFEEFRDAQVPSTLRELAERNIAQTRELYERSKEALKAVLVSWNKSFGAANQGAVALNLKIMDIAERNISTGFDLAMSLAGAKNAAEAIELQSAYWRKHLGRLQTQAEEIRALSNRLSANVAKPIDVRT
jgi:hypothetical protein